MSPHEQHRLCAATSTVVLECARTRPTSTKSRCTRTKHMAKLAARSGSRYELQHHAERRRQNLFANVFPGLQAFTRVPSLSVVFKVTRATRDAHKSVTKSSMNFTLPCLPPSTHPACLRTATRGTLTGTHTPTPPSLRNGAFMVPHSPGGTLCQALCTLPGWGSPHIARFRQRFSLTL